MKKSNLILIGAGLVYLIFIGAIPITLRYKLGHHDFTVINTSEDYPYTHHSPKEAKQIILEGLANCTIIPSDSLALEIENKEITTVVFMQREDTLMIHGSQPENGIQQKIRVYLPTDTKIIADRSAILLRGSTAERKKVSYQFELKTSKLFTKPFIELPRIPQSFHQLIISGSDRSVLDLQGIIRMNKLTVADVDQFTYGGGFSSGDVDISYHDRKVVESRGHDGSVVITSK